MKIINNAQAWALLGFAIDSKDLNQLQAPESHILIMNQGAI